MSAKKREAASVTVKCAKCEGLFDAYEGTIGKCPACDQANAVLSAGSVKQPEDEDRKKLKAGTRKQARKEDFAEDAKVMLYGDDDDEGEEYDG